MITFLITPKPGKHHSLQLAPDYKDETLPGAPQIIFDYREHETAMKWLQWHIRLIKSPGKWIHSTIQTCQPILDCVIIKSILFNSGLTIEIYKLDTSDGERKWIKQDRGLTQ